MMSVSILASPGVVGIAGELDPEGARVLRAALGQLSSPAAPLRLELGDLDLADGVALASLVTTLRELAARTPRLVLSGAPQLLAHTLYKIGALDGIPVIELVETRQEEPYG